MPSRRMIDPAIWQSETMGQLSRHQRLLFIGLFSNADDQGRLKGHPALIRSCLFPYDDISLDEIGDDLNAIEAAGSIQSYSVDGKDFIQIVGWWTYQSPQWAYPSPIPPPTGWRDRLRYRKNNNVVTDNWHGADDSQEDSIALGNALGKALPKTDSQGDGQSHSIRDSIRVSTRDRDKADSPSGTDAPVPKPEDPEMPKNKASPSRAMFSAVAEVCRWDLKTITKEQRGQLNQSEKILRKAGAAPDQLPEFGVWWYRHDWRGKKGEDPTPAQIRETWGKFGTWCKERVPPEPAPAREPHEAALLWDRIRAELALSRPEVGGGEFEQTRGVALDNGSLHVACPLHARGWLEERIPQHVNEAAATVRDGLHIVFENYQ